MRFRYFLLVPKPLEGGLKRVWAAKRKVWMSEPMILIPLYLDDYGKLQKAPVNQKALNGNDGFEVTIPSELFKDHKQLIKFGLFLVKASIKIAVKQGLGMCVDLGTSFDLDNSGLDEILEDTMKAVDTMEAVDKLLTAPQEAAEEMVRSPDAKRLTNDQYDSLKAWLDSKHKGWEKNLGLVNKRAPDGSVSIVPAPVQQTKPAPVQQTEVEMLDETGKPMGGGGGDVGGGNGGGQESNSSACCCVLS